MKKRLTLMFSAALIMCDSFSLHAQEKVQESRIKIVKTTDEGLTIFAGKYNRLVDISGKNKAFYLNISQGNACYTKKLYCHNIQLNSFILH